MFTGALAVSHYGTPRTTTDIDVMVKIAPENACASLVPALKKAGLQANEKQIEAALKSDYRIATFKDNKTPLTLDMIFLDDKFEKKAGTILGLPTFFQTSEDLILTKLRMIKATIPREKALKDKDDIRAILTFTALNLDDVKRQAKKNDTSSILEALLADKTRKGRKRS